MSNLKKFKKREVSTNKILRENISMSQNTKYI